MGGELHSVIATAIEKSTHDVFSTMVGLEIESTGTTSERRPPSSRSGLVALIGLAGNWSGTGGMGCSEEMACKLASAFLKTPYESPTEEVFDAVGEIANMIIGNVKATLEDMLGPIGLSTPTVIFGPQIQTRGAHTLAWTVVTFNCSGQNVYVQLCLAGNKATPKHILAAFPPISRTEDSNPCAS